MKYFFYHKVQHEIATWWSTMPGVEANFLYGLFAGLLMPKPIIQTVSDKDIIFPHFLSNTQYPAIKNYES